MAGILLMGAALRWFRIGHQSFWDDEVVTLTVAKMDIPVLWDLIGSIDFNPPFYYVLLHFWGRLGSGEVAYRSLSALLGVAAIGLTYLVGKQIVGKWGGIAGAALIALSPLAVFSAQETRYYQLLTCLSLASFYFLIRLLEEGRWILIAGLSLSTTLLVYTHYYAFFFIAAILFYLLALSVRTIVILRGSNARLQWLFNLAVLSRLEIIRWPATVAFLSVPLAAKKVFFNILKAMFALTLAGLAFIPFLRFFTLQVLRGMPGRDPTPFSEMVKRFFIYLFIGHSPVELPTLIQPLERLVSANPAIHEWILLALIFPFMALLLAGLCSRLTWYRGFLATALIVPAFLIFLFSSKIPVFEPRYLAPLIPFACLAAGAGLRWMFARHRIVATVLCIYLLLLSAMSLGDYYFKPRYARQDWRNTARFVTQEEKSSDFIAFYNYYTALPFNYYYSSETPVVYLFDFEDRYRPMEVRRRKLNRMLDQLKQDAGRIWLVDYHGSHDDPQDLARKGLESRDWVKCFQRCSLSGLYRFCLELYVPSGSDSLGLHADVIDFSTGAFNEMQLQRGFYAGDGPWRWIGKEAVAVFQEPEAPYRITAEFYADYDLLGGEPFSIRFDANESNIGALKIDRSDIYRWKSDIIHPSTEKGELAVRILSDRAFVPNRVLQDGDPSMKSILIKRVAIIDAASGEGP